MRSFKDYFLVLDEIRKSRGVTVTDLCEDIISERTYYRHMISNNNIRFDVFNQLASRLNVQPYEIIQYATFVRTGDPGVTRFMYRVHVQHFDDIDEIYKDVIKLNQEKDGLSLLLKVYIKKYECIIGKINNDEYKQVLIEVEEIMRGFKLPNVYVYTFRTLYLLEFGDTETVSLQETVKLLTDCDPGFGVLFLNFAFFNIFLVILKTRNIGIEVYNKLFEKMSTVVQFFPHKYFHTRYMLYSCYGDYLSNNIEAVNQNIYRYLLGNILLLKQDRFDEETKIVKELFDIEPMEYLRKQIKSLMVEKLTL